MKGKKTKPPAIPASKPPDVPAPAAAPEPAPKTFNIIRKNGLDFSNYKQKPSNFCHFATPMGNIIDDPVLRGALQRKIIPERILDLGDGNYIVRTGKRFVEFAEHRIHESELANVKIEGPKEIKLLAKAYEERLMASNPDRYVKDGRYADHTGDTGGFFYKLFNIPSETPYMSNLPGRPLNEVLKKYNPNEYMLIAASNSSPQKPGLIARHFHFIKDIQGDNVILKEPFNMNKTITVPLREFENNFETLTAVSKSAFMQ